MEGEIVVEGSSEACICGEINQELKGDLRTLIGAGHISPGREPVEYLSVDSHIPFASSEEFVMVGIVRAARSPRIDTCLIRCQTTRTRLVKAAYELMSLAAVACLTKI